MMVPLHAQYGLIDQAQRFRIVHGGLAIYVRLMFSSPRQPESMTMDAHGWPWKTIMPGDLTGTMRPMYRARIEQGGEVRLGVVTGSVNPLSLTLGLVDRPEVRPPLSDQERGAGLTLDLRWEELVVLYTQIRDFARASGRELPAE